MALSWVDLLVGQAREAPGSGGKCAKEWESSHPLCCALPCSSTCRGLWKRNPGVTDAPGGRDWLWFHSGNTRVLMGRCSRHGRAEVAPALPSSQERSLAAGAPPGE